MLFCKESLLQIYYLIRGFLFKGKKYYCPCCRTKLRKFLPGGVVKRSNAKCPRCGSLERHRLLWLYLERKTNFFTDSLRVLDVSPSYFQQRQLKLCKNLDYISADLHMPWAMVKLDVTATPFKDNYFDRIICYHVLEHILDDRKAIKEIYRILKAGGWAILQSPVDQNRKRTFEVDYATTPEERLRLFGQADHFRIYGQDYYSRLEEAGFKVEVDDFVKHLSGDEIKRYGVFGSELLYVCHKPK